MECFRYNTPMAVKTLQEIATYSSQPRRVIRYLQQLIGDSESSTATRLEANNLLGIIKWHQQDVKAAIDIFQKTVHMDPNSTEAIWAMKMLAFLYKKTCSSSERLAVEMARLSALRRMLHFSDAKDEIEFAYSELMRECSDRGLLE